MTGPTPRRPSQDEKAKSRHISATTWAKNYGKGSLANSYDRSNQSAKKPKAASVANSKSRNHGSARTRSGRNLEKAPIILFLLIAFFALLGTMFAVDFKNTNGRVYSGVSVGGVDLSNMNYEESYTTLQSNYEYTSAHKDLYVVSQDDVQTSLNANLDAVATTGDDAQRNIDQFVTDGQAVVSTTANLEVAPNYEQMVSDAMALGRNTVNPFERLIIQFFGAEISPQFSYNESVFSAYIDEINATLGTPVVENAIAFDSGTAQVVPGESGNITSREEIQQFVERTVLGDMPYQSHKANFVEASPSVGLEDANRSADMINNQAQFGINLSYGDNSHTLTSADFIAMLSANVVKNNEGKSVFEVVVNDETFVKNVYNNLASFEELQSLQMAFENNDGQITVHAKEGSESKTMDIPGVIKEITNSLFSEGATMITSAPTFNIASTVLSGQFAFQDALDMGLIALLGTHTLNYTASPYERQFNIHKGSDSITNSIAKANGGAWSFVDVAGDFGEGSDYKHASVIEDGEFTTEIGGGICMVSSVVFNAVLNAGLPITDRTPHTFYVSSYEPGLDAAVSYPELNFAWENNLNSDVILQMSYTDTSVTASIFGVNYGNEVVITTPSPLRTSVPFDTKYIVDPSKPEGYEQGITAGVDGTYIVINRKTLDINGNVILDADLVSSYAPVDRVIEVSELPEDVSPSDVIEK